MSAENFQAIIDIFAGLLPKRLGGPDTSYIRNSLGEAFMELDITNGRLDAFSHHFRSAVEVMEMPQDLVHEILSKVKLCVRLFRFRFFSIFVERPLPPPKPLSTTRQVHPDRTGYPPALQSTP